MDKAANTLINFIIQNKDLFPESGISLVIYLILTLAVIILLKYIAKSLQDPELIQAALFISTKTKDVSKVLIKGASNAIESPIKRPKTRLVATILSVAHSYLSAIVFLSIDIVIAFFYYSKGSDLIWSKHILMVGIIVGLFWFTLFFRAQADRDFIDAKAQWENRNEW